LVLGSTPTATRNPFVKELFQKNITIDNIASNSNSGCRYEWNKFGTFCDEQKLAEFSKKDSTNINRSLDLVLEELSNCSWTF
jgi:hypothetical protein